MKIVSTISDLQKLLCDVNRSMLGLVPTMGALHRGHISLVENAISMCPVIVVSIYVNPTQFNDREDLKRYPRPLKEDLEILVKYLRRDDIVFTPDDSEMYPVEDQRVFNFGNLDKVMEALHRPGHFNGVAQIVSRLFEIIIPGIAFFGFKDFQQVAVIKELVKQNHYNIKIEICPIIREEDGLAMSSRNMLLEPRIRKDASVIYNTISRVSEMMKKNDIPEIKSYVKETIEKKPGFRVEYFEIADDEKLIPAGTKNELKQGTRYYGCIAVKAGEVRLIDNIEIVWP
jgi:pantoate--beta-alanine ligase